MWFVRRGEKLYPVPGAGTGSQWYKNLLNTPAVRLSARGAQYSAIGTPVTDADVFQVLRYFPRQSGAKRGLALPAPQRSRRDTSRVMAQFTHDAAPRLRTPPLDGLIASVWAAPANRDAGWPGGSPWPGIPSHYRFHSSTGPALAAEEVGRGLSGLASRDAIREANLVIVAVPTRATASCWRAWRPTLARSSSRSASTRSASTRAARTRCRFPRAAPLRHRSPAARQHGGGSVPPCIAVLLLDPEARLPDQDVFVLRRRPGRHRLGTALAAGYPGYGRLPGPAAQLPAQVESLTANLHLQVDRRYKAHAGLRITDI